MKKLIILLLFPLLGLSQVISNEFYIGDPLPDAPLLSKIGKHKVGVKTLKLVNENQLDILIKVLIKKLLETK